MLIKHGQAYTSVASRRRRMVERTVTEEAVLHGQAQMRKQQKGAGQLSVCSTLNVGGIRPPLSLDPFQASLPHQQSSLAKTQHLLQHVSTAGLDLAAGLAAPDANSGTLGGELRNAGDGRS